MITARSLLFCAGLAAALSWAVAAPRPALAQEITANYAADVSIIQAEIGKTHAAASAGNATEARVAMENTFRLWRIFRQRNIDSRPKDPSFAADIIKTEEHLFTATRQVDQQQWKAAAAELDRARQLLAKIPLTATR